MITEKNVVLLLRVFWWNLCTEVHSVLVDNRVLVPQCTANQKGRGPPAVYTKKEKKSLQLIFVLTICSSPDLVLSSDLGADSICIAILK